MNFEAKQVSAPDTLSFRTRQREELNGQIVHDSIHRRPGWTVSYILEADSQPVGFGSVAIGGPWKDKPTLFEFYVLPHFRNRSFDLFEALLATGKPQYFEAQTNDALIAVMVHTYGSETKSEKIVFRDGLITDHALPGTVLRLTTAGDELRSCIEQRQGGGEWLLQLDGREVGKGGILFHYNRPYGDIYMEVQEGSRRCGLGSFLVQELKRECYVLGAVPAARCSPDNIASRRTLVRAGFVPCAHILQGRFPAA